MMTLRENGTRLDVPIFITLIAIATIFWFRCELDLMEERLKASIASSRCQCRVDKHAGVETTNNINVTADSMLERLTRDVLKSQGSIK